VSDAALFASSTTAAVSQPPCEQQEERQDSQDRQLTYEINGIEYQDQASDHWCSR
jgi:hypothetical protein